MEYVNLGKSGLKVCHTQPADLIVIKTPADLRNQVSKLVLGCMQYGSGQDWMIPDHEEGIRQLKYAYDKGINVSLLTCFSIADHLLDSDCDYRRLTRPTRTRTESPKSSSANSCRSTISSERAWSSSPRPIIRMRSLKIWDPRDWSTIGDPAGR